LEVERWLTNELDLAQARTSVETVKANLAMYQRQLAPDFHYLTLLTGKNHYRDFCLMKQDH